MTQPHDCPTGYHSDPYYGCYSNHGCRCDGCRKAKIAVNRRWRNGEPVGDDLGKPDTPQGRWARAQAEVEAETAAREAAVWERMTVSVPRRSWERMTTGLQSRGMSVDRFLHWCAIYANRTTP